jgi:signal transduction histidine kinase
VILVTLLVVAVALFGFASLSTVRFSSGLQRLAAVSLSNRSELLRLRGLGADAGDFEQLLLDTAAQQNVRILLADPIDRRVAYDTGSENSWEGVIIADVVQPRRLDFNSDQSSIYGRFQHPNGTRWLIYSQPTREFANILIFYAQREPTPLDFFREFFLRPLLGAGAVALLLAVILAFVITNSVARPLQDLVQAAGDVAQGAFDRQLSLTGPNEVRQVAQSFNLMTGQVQQTQRAQREFVANVSHDLKTPVTAISGWSQALIDGTASSPAEQQHAATIIHDEAARLMHMVEQLLDLARLESGQMDLARRPVDVTGLLAGVEDAMRPQAEISGIRLEVGAGPIPMLVGDAERLRQALTNLVDNALHYTPAGGTVAVQATANGREVVITVHDTGPGISAADQARIFERFYRVDRSRAHDRGAYGSGLGLAIARQITEAHSGRLEVTSVAGKGTTFSIFLPAGAGANGGTHA